MTIYELKVVYQACCQQYFPDFRMFISTIYSTQGKTHKNFEELLAILMTNKLAPHQYLPYCFSRADKMPTVKQLCKAESVEEFKHEHAL